MNGRPNRYQPAQPLHRINGRIKAREVRVIGQGGQQVGVLDLPAALALARQQGVDLVEIAPNAQPPVCRLVDYGKFKYELAKKERDAKKHQHANLVKELQLTPRIDPHDLGIKMHHAIDFLCEDMKIKVSLRFRGREMAHTEIGEQVVQKFLADLAPWGHPDSPPRLIGRSINVMVSPLPKQKRAKNPHEGAPPPPPLSDLPEDPGGDGDHSPARRETGPVRIATDAAERPSGFGNPAFSSLDLPGGQAG
ncbi:MAG: translation initiation factor IF-3 [Verrucomicrobiota bacterium]